MYIILYTYIHTSFHIYINIQAGIVWVPEVGPEAVVGPGLDRDADALDVALMICYGE